MFGEGSGDSLNHVVETEIGAIGHLNCWENVSIANSWILSHCIWRFISIIQR
jgi:hypothetical protein